MPTSKDPTPAWGAALAALLVAAHAALVLHQATRQSAAYDEPYYAPAGWALLAGGGPRMNPEHPPAVKLWLGAALLGAGLPEPRAVPGFAPADQWTFGPNLLYRSGVPAGRLLLRARAAVVVLSVLLAVGVLLVARRAFGGPAGLFALGLYALDPLVVANAGLATLDLGAAAAIFGAVALAWLALDTGKALHVAAAGVVAGLALGAKGTGVLVIAVLPIVALAPLARRGGAAPGEVRRRLGRLAAIAAGGTAVLSVVTLPAGPAVWWDAVARQRAHAAAGHATFAMGLRGLECWAWWFPYAWLVKTPIPILAATATGAVVVLAGARRKPEVAAALLAAPVLLLGAAMASGICNGVRQLLPATPFLAVAGGAALSLAWRGLAGRLAALAALAWAGAGLALVHPNAIAYSNEVGGGPARTWRLLTDSNVDWGQELPQLAEVLRGVPVRRLWLDYFGTAFPPASGVDRYRKVQDHRFRAGAVLAAPRADGPDSRGREFLAVSATCLVDVYVPEADLHAWLRTREPWAWAGHGIAVYDVTDDAAAHRELARMAERMQDPRTAAEARSRAEEIEAAGAGSPSAR
jgi:hypothetical protein